MTGRNSQPKRQGRNKAGQADRWLDTFRPIPMNLFVPHDQAKLKRIPQPEGDWPTAPTREATAQEIREAARRGA
jgi:hypothetical protein